LGPEALALRRRMQNFSFVSPVEQKARTKFLEITSQSTPKVPQDGQNLPPGP